MFLQLAWEGERFFAVGTLVLFASLLGLLSWWFATILSMVWRPRFRLLLCSVALLNYVVAITIVIVI